MKKSFQAKTIILAGSLLLQLSTLCFHLRGAAGDMDLSFDASSAVTNSVSVVVAQPDGNVDISGDFLTVNGALRPRVARLFGDSADPAPIIAWSSGYLIVSWPASAIGFVLQQTTNLNAPNWTAPPETVTDNGVTKSISVRLAPGNRFFRLFKP